MSTLFELYILSLQSCVSKNILHVFHDCDFEQLNGKDVSLWTSKCTTSIYIGWPHSNTQGAGGSNT